MSQKILYLTIIFTIMGIILSQLLFIPTWEEGQIIVIIPIFLFSAILGIVYLRKLWSQSPLKLIDRIKSIVISVIIILGIPISFGLSLFSYGQGFLGPSFHKEIILGDERIYVYHNGCFIPDGLCECNYYYSVVYRKNAYLPIMHLLTEVDFYVNDVRLHKNELIISSSNECYNDIGKTKKIKF